MKTRADTILHRYTFHCNKNTYLFYFCNHKTLFFFNSTAFLTQKGRFYVQNRSFRQQNHPFSNVYRNFLTFQQLCHAKKQPIISHKIIYTIYNVHVQ